MKKPVLLGFLILIAAVVSLGVFWSIDSGKTQVVTVTEVKLSDLHSHINTNGKIEAEKVFELHAPLPGRCTRIFVREGAQLKSGDPVIAVDDSSLRSELASARAELATAETELRNVRRGPAPEELSQAEAEIARYRLETDAARKTLEANERLLQKGAVSKFEVEESRRGLARAEQSLQSAITRRDDIQRRYDALDRQRTMARVEAAKSRISFLESSIDRSILRAPASGTLYQFDVRDGAYLEAGALVGLLADLTRLRVRAFVDEPEMGRVALGNTVIIHWDARPQEPWKGAVAHIPSQVVARGTRSVAEVLCSISSSQQTLIPNINVDVEIETAQGPKVPTLPRECVFPEGKNYFVWVVQNGQARKRNVVSGRATSTFVEVTGGLSVGDRVIIPADFPLTEGMKVRVAEE
jgi:HlyD family secretion protein